jgi:hypothetical protein
VISRASPGVELRREAVASLRAIGARPRTGYPTGRPAMPAGRSTLATGVPSRLIVRRHGPSSNATTLQKVTAEIADKN